MQNYSMMSQLSMDLITEEKSPSSQQGSLVNRIALLESVRHLVMSVISGEKSSESWARCNPDGFWVRTSQASSLPSLEYSSVEWSMTWTKWGIAWAGECMELKMSEPSTAETESSLLATPRASQDYKPIRQLSPSEADGTHGRTLVADIGREMLPTPTASEQKYRLKGNSQQSKCLEAKARRGELINPSLEETGNNGESSPRLGLNPEFVEAMMGFPIGWTDLNPSETP